MTPAGIEPATLRFHLTYERKNSFGMNFVGISQIQFIVLVMTPSLF